MCIRLNSIIPAASAGARCAGDSAGIDWQGGFDAADRAGRGDKGKTPAALYKG